MPVRQRAALVIVLAAAYWALLFVLTHLPIHFNQPTKWFDKVEHTAAYCGLALLLCAAWAVFRPPGWAMAAVVVAIAAGYGALDEASQLLVPGRSADVRDWIADVAGAIAGVGVFLAGWKIWVGRQHQRDATG
jgi:VanZ family protein